VVECTRIVPVFPSNISSLWSTTDIENNAEEDETYDSNNFDNGEDKFGCCGTSARKLELPSP
jgi:hypothetical protein